MSKFELYNVNLKSMAGDKISLDFDLNDEFFHKIDSPEVQKGEIKAKVTVLKKIGIFELTIKLEGHIMIPCNRCLDDMQQSLKYEEKILVKLGEGYGEEDDIVIIPENEGIINIAWFMYEFIVLNIPIKHIHAPGECNKTMVTKLKKHITHHKDEDDDNPLMDDDDDDEISNENTSIDPRWEGLQNILDNN